MKILNVRLGFATNSSSNHSIIFWEPDKADEIPKESRLFGNHYGQQSFTLTSPERKLSYLGVAIYEALQAALDDEKKALQVTNALFEREVVAEDDYIDHGSMLYVPVIRHGGALDFSLAKQMMAFFEREEVVIVGDDYTAWEDFGRIIPLKDRLDSSGMIFRQDPSGLWSVFNPSNGAKIRFTFDDDLAGMTKNGGGYDEDERPVYVSTWPELVDIKITDFCDIGCAFCYQGSTKKGKHGDFDDIAAVIRALGKNGTQTFEVAIGGGEPTTHPRLVDILKLCREEGIVPNLTTRSFEWFKEDELRTQIFDLCGGIGFSVQSAADVRRLCAITDKFRPPARSTWREEAHFPKFVLQAIPAVVEDLDDLLVAAREVREEVLLLGYKNTGRGHSFRPKRESTWLASVQKALSLGWMHLGIDTALARSSLPQLHAAGIPRMFYSIYEGTHSMYIDAVERTMAACSYSGDATILPIDTSLEGQALVDQIVGGFQEVGRAHRIMEAAMRL